MHTSQQVNKVKMFYMASFRQRVVAAIVCLAVVAYFGGFALAGHYKVDMGRHLGYCGFQQKYGLPCPTCGMTTGTLAFAQGRIAEAFHIQPAAALLYCAAIVAAALALFVAVFGIYFGFIKRFFAEVKIRHIILALVIILASGWAVTLARAIVANR
jgi:hypothetical protein